MTFVLLGSSAAARRCAKFLARNRREIRWRAAMPKTLIKLSDGITAIIMTPLTEALWRRKVSSIRPSSSGAGQRQIRAKCLGTSAHRPGRHHVRNLGVQSKIFHHQAAIENRSGAPMAKSSPALARKTRKSAALIYVWRRVSPAMPVMIVTVIRASDI